MVQEKMRTRSLTSHYLRLTYATAVVTLNHFADFIFLPPSSILKPQSFISACIFLFIFILNLNAIVT